MWLEEQLEILRRICDRGLRYSAEKDSSMADLFQHLKDEIERITLRITREKDGK